jgi:hypothetical protein
MKNKLSVLLFFFLGQSSFAEDGRDIFNEVSDGNLGSVPGQALTPPTRVCSTAGGPSSYLDELISKSFKSDESCQKVFTGNKGNTEQGDETYAKALAYAMAEEMCGNSELHQNFVGKKLNNSDALSLKEFDGSNVGKTNSNNAAATYSLIYALGYRESSGNFIRPRDPWAKNNGSQKESGFTQTSANSLNNPYDGSERHILPQKVFKHYVSNLSKMSSQQQMAKFCLNDKLKENQQTRLILDDSKGEGKKIEFDHEGRDLFELFKDQSGSCKDLKTNAKGEYVANDSDNDAVVKCFNDLHKNCPGFSIKYGATIARTNRNHHGPLKPNTQKKPDPKPSCQLLFNSIVEDKEKICKELATQAGPDVEVKNHLTDQNFQAGLASTFPTISLERDADYLTPSSTDEGPGLSYNFLNQNDSLRVPFKENKPSDFSDNTVPRSKLSIAQSLNEDAFREFIGNLSTRSSGWCAKNVRLALNQLFGRGPAGGPSALKYDESVLSQWQTKDAQYKKVEDNGAFQDFDIRVLQPSGRGNPHGHIEIYYQGQWYSDFKQGGSLWDYNSGNYIEATTYRLTPKTSAMIIFEKLEMIASVIFPEAWAAEREDERKTPNKEREVILAKVKDSEGVEWIMVNQELGDFSFPILYKILKGKKVKVDEDNKSPYLLLNRLQNKNLAQAIANNYVDQWIKDQGKENVQKIIQSRRNFFELEIEALKKSGIKTPKEYKILIN